MNDVSHIIMEGQELLARRLREALESQTDVPDDLKWKRISAAEWRADLLTQKERNGKGPAKEAARNIARQVLLISMVTFWIDRSQYFLFFTFSIFIGDQSFR